MYGSETRQLSKNALDPNPGKYGRGRETTDIDENRENTDIYNFHLDKFGQCKDLLHRQF